MDSRRESDADVPLCILLNVWEDDYCRDPLLSLVDAIEKELSERTSGKKAESHLESQKALDSHRRLRRPNSTDSAKSAPGLSMLSSSMERKRATMEEQAVNEEASKWP